MLVDLVSKLFFFVFFVAHIALNIPILYIVWVNVSLNGIKLLR